jgi:tetratricopeptide (TPR) repeat protein
LTPPATEALLLVGSVAREDDDRRAALERALPALVRVEDRARALAEIGRLWRSQRRDDAATSRWRQAIALDPSCVQAQLALAREEQDTGLAASALARVTALPEDARGLPLVQDALAEIYRTLGRPADAEAAVRAIHDVRRSDVGVLRELAVAARRRGDLGASARWQGEALRWRPDLMALVFDQASALEGSGDVPGARSVLSKAMARLPDDPGLPDELGRLEARAGRFEAAVANMRRSLELRPQNPGLHRYVDALMPPRRRNAKRARSTIWSARMLRTARHWRARFSSGRLPTTMPRPRSSSTEPWFACMATASVNASSSAWCTCAPSAPRATTRRPGFASSPAGKRSRSARPESCGRA